MLASEASRAVRDNLTLYDRGIMAMIHNTTLECSH